ncbi:MAG TPA: acyl-CoA dehydrogenase family protein [Longimicrobiales bacterium]
MNFEWSEDQLAFRDSVLEFARHSLNEDIIGREKEGVFSRELWQRCAEFGIQGLPLPEEYGGQEADVLTTMIAMEALGYVCRDQGLFFSIHAHMWAVELPILAYGTAEQKQRFLPGLASGQMIGAHGMSEPDSGSDAFKLGTRAERRGDVYVLNGTKTFVTNAPIADLFVLFANVRPDQGIWGVTAFLAERGTKGLSVGKPIEKMGLTTSPMAEVILDDCEIPVDNLLGKEGQGIPVFNHSMGWERSCILASMVGGMQWQLEQCLAHARERKQFGKRIGDFQMIASKIVDMKVRLETSRLLLYRAATAQATGKDNGLEAAMAKLYISEAAVQSGLDAVQIHGGYGYTREYRVEQTLRDAVGGRLYSGTSEIQRIIIARYLGLSPLK